MQYEQIKRNARKLAQQLHDDWVEQHLQGRPLDDHGVGNLLEAPSDLSTMLQEAIIRGEPSPDELEDYLAGLMFSRLQKRTLDEWRDPDHYK